MTPRPEIAPEIRGLLEEIIADPRSSLRLVPRAPLRQWFDSGESLRTADVARTRAERHLIDEHREELAMLLHDAAVIAFWKAPVMVHPPIGKGGKPVDPCDDEPSWQTRARKEVASRSGPDVVLLEQCLRGITNGLGYRLSQASLALAPNDRTRFCLSCTVPVDSPRTALGVLRRLASRRHVAVQQRLIAENMAKRLCSTGEYRMARDSYRQASSYGSTPQVGSSYALNLSCFLGEESEARKDARELAALVGPQDGEVGQAAMNIMAWIKTVDPRQVAASRALALRLLDSVAAPSRQVLEALTT